MKRNLMIGAAIGALAAAPAMAEVTAKATTDLNLRAGPGAWHEVVGVIPAEAEATVTACYSEVNWCEVSHDGTSGWAYGEYLVVGETAVAIVAPEVVEQPETYTITRLEVDDQSNVAAATGAGWGAIAGALIAGPAGAAIGSVAAAGLADSEVGPEVTAYIETNPVEPVYLNGELVTGAIVPDEIQVYEYPDNTKWAYLNINGQPVVIETETRRIVTIVQ